MNAPHGLWAITAYFNPARFQRRRANFRIFRQHLPVPLLAVELAFGDHLELERSDADILVPLRGGDVMWQKERLLNVALENLPTSCRKVVWIDCDLLVDSHHWPARIARALDEVPLVQPFHRLGHLSAEVTVPDPNGVECWQSSLAYSVAQGRSPSQGLGLLPKVPPVAMSSDYLTRVAAIAHPGMVWAAQRDLLDRHRFYDASIIGGGDVLFACAAFGCFEDWLACRRTSEAERSHYRSWATSLFDSVRGRVGNLEGTVFHLWHGNLRDRQYLERRDRLCDLGFDPHQDITRTPQGAWRWNSQKPALHQFLRDYFISRREDG